MIEKYLCTDGDTGHVSLLIPLGTKNYRKANAMAEELVNDILSSITISKRTETATDSPMFLGALKRIEKKLWTILR